MRFPAILFVTLFLSGCAGGILPTVTSEGDANVYDRALKKMAEVGPKDLASAKLLAEAANDRPAVVCYDALIPWAEDLVAYRDAVADAQVGVFTTIQRLRNARHLIRDGAPVEVRIACAEWADESGSVINVLLGAL